MPTDSGACDEAAEEGSQVIYGSLMSKTLELMIKLDSVTVMEDSVVQFTDCLKQLDDVSEKIDTKDLSSLTSPIEKYIHTVYSLLNKFFDGKHLYTYTHIYNIVRFQIMTTKNLFIPGRLPAHAWFLEISLSGYSVCMCVSTSGYTLLTRQSASVLK